MTREIMPRRTNLLQMCSALTSCQRTHAHGGRDPGNPSHNSTLQEAAHERAVQYPRSEVNALQRPRLVRPTPRRMFYRSALAHACHPKNVGTHDDPWAFKSSGFAYLTLRTHGEPGKMYRAGVLSPAVHTRHAAQVSRAPAPWRCRLTSRPHSGLPGSHSELIRTSVSDINADGKPAAHPGMRCLFAYANQCSNAPQDPLHRRLGHFAYLPRTTLAAHTRMFGPYANVALGCRPLCARCP